MTATDSSYDGLREQQQVTGPHQSNEQPIEVQSSKSSTEKTKRHIEPKTEDANSSRDQVTSKPDSWAKGRSGYLKQITEIPMDVLYEIFGYLEPIDLLHLSWTNKLLQSTIMKGSARCLWTNAFNALYATSQAPPPCPPDLNLAQYTKLLFVERCMECNSHNVTYVLWAHRLRVCGRCLNGERFHVLTTMNEYWRGIPVLPTSVYGKKHRYVLKSELNEVKAKKASVNPDSREWTKYVKQRVAWMSDRRLNEWTFMQWQMNQKQNKKNGLEEIRVRRRKAILANLSDLGWKEELDSLTDNQVSTLPGMKIAKPLTDKAWKKLCPEVIEHLQVFRKSRLERERGRRIAKRCSTLSKKISRWAAKQSQPQDMLPRVLDVALTQPFKSFIFDDSDTEPTFITDTDELAKTMEQFTEVWNKERDVYLLSLFPDSSKKSSAKDKSKAKPSALNLATTFFRCSSGQVDCSSAGSALPYPDVLKHSCQRPPCKKENRRSTDPYDLWELSAHFYTRPWLHHCQDLSFDQTASNIARMVVQECGENPDEVTAERMDALRFECVRCSEPKIERCVMKWDTVIRHELEKHAHNGAPSFGGEEEVEKSSTTKWRLVIDPEVLNA